MTYSALEGNSTLKRDESVSKNITVIVQQYETLMYNTEKFEAQ